uniref:Uncharacterized protein n=1 Tax=Trypanosoma vivax (strain Y486) TaxID=1055687 RepID=G0TX04_TRYVY|nr:hypothetical protein TVY486_0602840 [Trypanosoma vivax Y486]
MLPSTPPLQTNRTSCTHCFNYAELKQKQCLKHRQTLRFRCKINTGAYRAQTLKYTSAGVIKEEKRRKGGVATTSKGEIIEDKRKQRANTRGKERKRAIAG